MEISIIRIFVKDWQKACDFYQDTLGLQLEFNNTILGWAEFNVGGANFGIERVDKMDSQECQALVGRYLGISLKVENMDYIYSHLLHMGVEFTLEPTLQEWGGTVAEFKDPDGNILTLVSGI